MIEEQDLVSEVAEWLSNISIKMQEQPDIAYRVCEMLEGYAKVTKEHYREQAKIIAFNKELVTRYRDYK